MHLHTFGVVAAISSATAAASTFIGTGNLIVTAFGTNTNIGCLNSEGQWTTSTCGVYTGSKTSSNEYTLSTKAGSCLLLGQGPTSRFACVTGKGYENWFRDPADGFILTYGHVQDGPFYGSPPSTPSTLYLENRGGGLTEVQLQWQAVD